MIMMSHLIKKRRVCEGVFFQSIFCCFLIFGWLFNFTGKKRKNKQTIKKQTKLSQIYGRLDIMEKLLNVKLRYMYIHVFTFC